MDLHQDDWYLWKLNVKEGDSEFWIETLDFFEFTDLSDPENYRLAKENYVEIDHFTDYYIINIFAGNKSWLHGIPREFKNEVCKISCCYGPRVIFSDHACFLHRAEG